MAALIDTSSEQVPSFFASSITSSFTVNDVENRLLIVDVASFQINTTGVTYGSEALTLLGASGRVSRWYMINPPVGTANIIVSFNSSLGAGHMQATCWKNIQQDEPFGEVATATGTGASATLDVEAEEGDIVFHCIGIDTGIADFLTCGESDLISAEDSAGSTCMGNAQYETDEESEVEWAWSSSAAWGCLGVALKAVEEELSLLSMEQGEQMTLASVVIQDLTYTETQLGVGATITYRNGGTAGSERVTVSGHDITVLIAGGTSTATQIKAAVDAHTDANKLVTVTVSGTGSTAQKTCVLATLAGGAAATFASLQIGTILYTAKASGTGGNSIRIRYVNHSSTLSAAASTNDITLTFQNGVTKMSTLMATLRADSACNALVSVSQTDADDVVLVAYASSFTNLAGGAAAVAASVTIQDLKFAWDVTGTAGNGKTISYTTGATAGSEVGTVVGDNYNVQIQNGTSTATQIKTEVESVAAMVPAAGVKASIVVAMSYSDIASGDSITVAGHELVEGVDWDKEIDSETTSANLVAAIDALTEVSASDPENNARIIIEAATAGTAGNSIVVSVDQASPDGLLLDYNGPEEGETSVTLHDGAAAVSGLVVTVPGTGATAQRTVNAQVTAGGVGFGPDAYYKDQAATALTNAFVAFHWMFPSKQLTIVNDETSGAKAVAISFDGTTTHYTLTFGQSLSLGVDSGKYGVWLKYISAAPAYRLEAIG